MPARAFRLQSVLDYRKQLLEVRQQEMARLQLEMTNLESALDRIVRRIADVQEGVLASQQGPIDCVDLIGRFRYLEHLDGEKKQAQDRIDELAGRLEAKRHELVKAMQDKQALDKLKERWREHLAQEDLQAESKILDEMGVVRFYHANESGEN